MQNDRFTIHIKSDYFVDGGSKKMFIASIFNGIHKLLSGQDIQIVISNDTDLETLADAINNLSEIIGVSAMTLKIQDPSPDYDDYDPGDDWKK
jgi:hypothetical protein